MDIIFIALLTIAIVFMLHEGRKLHKEGKKLAETMMNWQKYGLPYNPNDVDTSVTIVEPDYNALLKEAKSIKKQ